MRMTNNRQTVLVHLASGIGNIVLATPLLAALNQMGFTTDLLMDADYQQTADLLRDWSAVRAIHAQSSTVNSHSDYDFTIPAVPPFYWPRFARLYRNSAKVVRRPPDSLFYQDEQEYYLSFARAIGYPDDLKPFYRLPVVADESFGVSSGTLVIAPGCKTGEMVAKRWPYFPQLAEAFKDVAVVGTSDDLRRSDGTQFQFPTHARLLIDKLSLRQTAEVMAAAGVVVGNDSGLSHIAAAAGAPTIMIFGPTPHVTLGRLPPNAKVMRAGLECEPCWFGPRFQACFGEINCLRQLTVPIVEQELRMILGLNSVADLPAITLRGCLRSSTSL